MAETAYGKHLHDVEQKTSDLYADCFKELNQWDDDTWYRQGEMLYTNLGLTEEKVSGMVCMDGGCGHGTLSYQLLANGAKEVWGVDLHDTLKRDAFTKYPNMKLVQASLLQMPIPDNTFDLVVSNGVLHHTADPDQCFREFVRVLKPGGRLVLGVYGKHGLFPYALSIARFFTVKLHVVPEKWVRGLISLLGLNPMTRYQLLDYLYVPCLNRYSPEDVIDGFFKKNDLKNPVRIFGLTSEKAKYFRSHHSVYTYDPRSLSSKLLFGKGFVVAEGFK